MAAKKTGTRRPAASRSAARPDKSVEAFRDALEKSLSLSRERIQEVADDAVKRGRMSSKDANALVSNFVSKGKRQTEDLLGSFERLVDKARSDLEKRAARARKEIDRQARRARKRTTGVSRRAQSAGKKATKTARGTADPALVGADKARRQAGVGDSFPISGYDALNVAQVKTRLADLTKPELRKVRTVEKKGKARKGILDTIEKKLAA